MNIKEHFLLLTLFIFLSMQGQKKPNILFIGFDDLRPELGCYGSDVAISPNLDKLASEGILFNKAYCQQAICGPSRASLLTGYRPETSGVFHNYIKFRQANPDVVTLPQHFKNNGYETVYFGKIFHHGDYDDEKSWSMQPDKSIKEPGTYLLSKNKKLAQDNLKSMIEKYGPEAKFGLGSGPAYEFADVSDNAYIDGFNTDLAIAQLQNLVKNKDKPFFLALGFNKPHLNWTAPKKYWDLYDAHKIKTTTQTEGPKDGAAMGLHASFELRTRSDIPKEGVIAPEMAVNLKHAYLSCVSYVDAQMGRMIAALEEAGVRDNTIIVVWSDHGWHLGEMGIWGKATDYEIATRIPMMIWTPDMPKGSRGKTSEALVELIDLYPTLSELAGFAIPPHVEGQSFVPLLSKPNKNWKSAAFSQFPDPALREWGAYPLRKGMRETFFKPLIEKVEQKIIDQQKEKWDRNLFENDLMGYTMRTQRYRLIVWKDTKHPDKKPIYIELYDHKKDPTETLNIAKNCPKKTEKLLAQFDKGWQGNKVR